nr:hypothetical protein [Tanacetum cinerariifolium]
SKVHELQVLLRELSRFEIPLGELGMTYLVADSTPDCARSWISLMELSASVIVVVCVSRAAATLSATSPLLPSTGVCIRGGAGANMGEGGDSIGGSGGKGICGGSEDQGDNGDAGGEDIARSLATSESVHA